MQEVTLKSGRVRTRPLSGPDLKNKATLGMLVAVTAIKEGHDVTLFLAAATKALVLAVCADSVTQIRGYGLGEAYLKVSLSNSMSNEKESGMFWKSLVVVAGLTLAVIVAVGSGLAKRSQCRTVYSLVVELRLSFFNR